MASSRGNRKSSPSSSSLSNSSTLSAFSNVETSSSSPTSISPQPTEVHTIIIQTSTRSSSTSSNEVASSTSTFHTFTTDDAEIQLCQAVTPKSSASAAAAVASFRNKIPSISIIPIPSTTTCSLRNNFSTSNKATSPPVSVGILQLQPQQQHVRQINQYSGHRPTQQHQSQQTDKCSNITQVLKFDVRNIELISKRTTSTSTSTSTSPDIPIKSQYHQQHTHHQQHEQMSCSQPIIVKIEPTQSFQILNENDTRLLSLPISDGDRVGASWIDLKDIAGLHTTTTISKSTTGPTSTVGATASFIDVNLDASSSVVGTTVGGSGNASGQIIRSKQSPTALVSTSAGNQQQQQQQLQVKAGGSLIAATTITSTAATTTREVSSGPSSSSGAMTGEKYI